MKILLPILMLMTLTLPALSEEMEIGNFTFDNPFEATKAEKLGVDAYSATWPAGKPYKEAAVEMIVASYDAEATKMMSEGGGRPFDAALSSFMGIYGKPESVNKALFFGGTSPRRVYNSSVPRKHEAHVFSKTLEDGSFVMVGVRVFDRKGMKYGDLLRAVSNTFKVKE